MKYTSRSVVGIGARKPSRRAGGASGR